MKRFVVLGFLLGIIVLGHAQEKERLHMPDFLVIPRTGEHVMTPLTTDDDARRLLDYPNAGLTATMRGLYQVYRAQGHAVFDAYRLTLEAHVKAHQRSKPQP